MANSKSKAKHLLFAQLIFSFLLVFSDTSLALAKAKLIYGQCKGSGCVVMAIDAIRSLQKVDEEELKAFFVVYGFEQSQGKPIMWDNFSSVEWAFCSATRPVIMSFSPNSRGKGDFVVGGINNDDEFAMASVNSSAVHDYVCQSSVSKAGKVDYEAVKKLEEFVHSPNDVFDR